MNKCLVRLLAIGVAGLSASPASGAQGFLDYASVVKVEPIVESHPVQVNRRLCEVPRGSSEMPIAVHIGEDIRRQRRRWEAHPDCRVVEEQAYRKRIVGYWVTYDYGGRIGAKRLSYDPGPRVPVTVNLTPVR